MDWNQYFVTVAMNPHRVIVVFVLVDSGGKLDVDLFGHACGDHTLLLASNLEIAGLRRQNVQSLRRRRVINQSKFHRVRLVSLEASKFDNTW